MTKPSKFNFIIQTVLKIAVVLLLAISFNKVSGQCCNYTLSMEDSYGDGWNGATIKLYINDTLQGSFSAQEYGSSTSFEVCKNDILRLNYSPGEYEEENSYKIYNAGWNVIYEDGPSPKVGNAISLPSDCNDIAIPGKHPCVALQTLINADLDGNNNGFTGSGIKPINCSDEVSGDIWYSTEAINSGNMEISINQRNDVVTGYAIWRGTECAGLRMVSCGNTDNADKKSTVKVYDIPNGQQVYIQLWGTENKKTSYSLSWKDTGRIILNGSDLPVISINTLGKAIPYGDKVNVKLEVIGDGKTYYNGDAGINVRGASSSGYPQQPFSIETRDAMGENNNVSLLGMPEENDWVLTSNFNDRSLVRNTLAHHLFNKMGNYSPATRLCEVLIDSSYKGIYVFSEKIKRDKNRVNISDLDVEDNTGDQLTGGYILQQNLRGDNDSFQSNYSPIDHPTFDVHFLYEYPDANTITDAQKSYIAGFVDSLETRLYSDNFYDAKEGYRRYLDVPSFIDYFLVNELARNADGFKKSIFYNKDRFSKGNKLKAGPVWDFDWAWKNLGICYLYDNFNGFGWAHLNNDCGPDNNSSGWYIRMLQDTTFANELRCTYESYRKTILATSYLNNYIDSVGILVKNAQARHFERWNLLGRSGPAPEIGNIATTYAAELDTLKSWINIRINWLDKNIPGRCSLSSSSDQEILNDDLFTLYPNPTTGTITIEGNFKTNASNTLSLYNTTGQLVDRLTLSSEPGKINYNFESKGTYFYTISSDGQIVKDGKISVL